MALSSNPFLGSPGTVQKPPKLLATLSIVSGDIVAQQIVIARCDRS